MYNYKTLTITSYFFVFFAIILLFLQIFSLDELFITDKSSLLYYLLSLWPLYFLIAIFLRVLGWLVARKIIHTIQKKNIKFTQAEFSEKQQQLRRSGVSAEKKLKHLAMRISWTPIDLISKKSIGWQDMNKNINKQEKKIKQKNNNLLVVIPKQSERLFAFYPLAIGILLLIISFNSDIFDWAVFLTSLGCISISLVLMSLNNTHYYFDKMTNTYGLKKYNLSYKLIKNKTILSLNKITALQILCAKEIGSRNMWQLNLITDNADRINIIKSRYRVGLTQGANIISKFLNIPIWEDIGVHMEVVQEQHFVWPTLDSIMDKLSGKKI